MTAHRNRVVLENLRYEYNAHLTTLDRLRLEALHPDAGVSHPAKIRAMLTEMFLDEWCEDNSIEPRHGEGWYWNV